MTTPADVGLTVPDSAPSVANFTAPGVTLDDGGSGWGRRTWSSFLDGQRDTLDPLAGLLLVPRLPVP